MNKNSKHILVPMYSQSGQLSKIVQQILAPLQATAGIRVTLLPIKLIKPYPFPWPFFQFLDVFPESVYGVAPSIEPLDFSCLENRDVVDVDLIILPYQVWYLAPSLPVQALLQDPQFRRIANGKPVVTIVACRNMWYLAHESIKKILLSMRARLLDNIVLTDQGGTFATFITVPRWLWTGKTNAFWGLPAAGVHPDEIKRSLRFGLALRDALLLDLEKGDNPMLKGLAAVTAEPTLLVSEKAATRSFRIWGKLLIAVGKPGAFARRPILFLYVIFLALLIITVVPLSLLLQLLRPFLGEKLEIIKNYYEAPSGSGKERLAQYDSYE
jgi:hypothetical protein